MCISLLFIFLLTYILHRGSFTGIFRIAFTLSCLKEIGRNVLEKRDKTKNQGRSRLLISTVETCSGSDVQNI